MESRREKRSTNRFPISGKGFNKSELEGVLQAAVELGVVYLHETEKVVPSLQDAAIVTQIDIVHHQNH